MEELLKRVLLEGEDTIEIGGIKLRFLSCGGLFDFVIEHVDGVIFSSEYAERIYRG